MELEPNDLYFSESLQRIVCVSEPFEYLSEASDYNRIANNVTREQYELFMCCVRATVNARGNGNKDFTSKEMQELGRMVFFLLRDINHKDSNLKPIEAK